MIKVIVFDLGGVLVDLDMDVCKDHFIKILAYEKITELLDPCHQKGIYSDLEEGKITPDEFRQLILKDSKPGSVAEDVDRCMYSFLTGMAEEKAPLLKELAKKYRLFILTNNNAISMARCHDVFMEHGIDYEKIFEHEFISAEMKMLKPSQAIYEEVIRQIGTAAEEILFIDDSVSNVEAASKLGIRAVHYVPGTDLRTTIMNALN